jgi:DNA end-binding protein Ku
MPRSLQTAALSFGLVNVPIRIYHAASSKSVSFHLLHKPDGSRVHQQLVCNAEEKVIDRKDTVKGYEIRKGQYVPITEEELESLEAEANGNVEILEFVPVDTVDPVYFDKTYYVGPDRGGDKAYSLLADAMQQEQRAAIAQLIWRGKEELVMIRPGGEHHLIMNTLYYADEVRDLTEIEVSNVKTSERELQLARQLIDGMSNEKWQPEKYRDTYRQRVLELIHRKEEGGKVAAPKRKHAPVVDLMAALKRSLETTGGAKGRPQRRPAQQRTPRRRQHRATA